MNPTHLPTSIRLAIIGVLLGSLCLLALGLTHQSSADSPPGSQKQADEALPPTFASAEERLAFEATGVATANEATRSFREEFISSNKDIHTLPAVYLHTTLLQDGTLVSSLAHSTGVVIGTVTLQTPERDGYVASHMRVDQSIDGAVRTPEIVVVQNGAPSLTSDGPGLVQEDQSPILIPGRQYLLFVRPAGTTTDGKYLAPFAVGGVGNIYLVTGGVLQSTPMPKEVAAELDGDRLEDAVSKIAAVAPGATRLAP